jgi:hypothetical protein
MGVGRGKLLQYVISFLPPASDFRLNICFDSARQARSLVFNKIYAKRKLEMKAYHKEMFFYS